VQDIAIAVAGLPTNVSVESADIVGYGGGEWKYNGPPNQGWAAAFVQAPGSSSADFYIEPYQVETGRYFWITFTYSDQSTATVAFMGGTADPSLRMPGQGVNMQWLGQDGQDWTSPDPAVGPDGFQDADIGLTQLSATVSIQSATLTSSEGASWAFGTNPYLLPDAELIQDPSDRAQGHLYFSPQMNMDGQTLTLTIDYADGTTDSNTVVAGATNPTLRMPVPTPVTVDENALAVSWLGQDGQDRAGPGDVHLALSGLPTGQTVVAAQLTDGTLNSWDYANAGTSLEDNNILPQPLAFQSNPSDPTQADVDFAPVRDESNTTMTLRLVLADGTNLVATFTGGPVNLGLRSAQPVMTSIVAAPGDDLNILANEFGSVHLTAGTYNLSAPLVLNQPVTITADPGTTLLFTQGPNAPTWTAAIKINAGNTTLSGFAVRFTGPINWTSGISYGPAVIGTTDNFDPGPGQLLENITLTNLDLESPPAASSWETAPDLIRLISAQSGVISDNTLKGGTTEFVGGPWQVVGNTYQGTVAGTWTATAFAGHFTHDLLLADNQAEPVGPAGKTYRFLVLTQSGINDVVKDNNVVGIGPMDDDTEPNPNATEVILTESYNVMYEGVPISISPDGLIVQVSSILSGTVQAGDVLSILAGPDAGQWRPIALEINPTTFLLASPIDPGTTAISISMGFVNESFVGNTIDTTGSSTAADLVLAGNQFGVQVRNNTLIGGNRALWITAYPSETPSTWGWTHAPVLGATISGNIIEDSVQGGVLDVEHGSAVKSNIDRVYLTATLTNNTGIWTDSFLAQPSIASATSPLTALTVGMAPSNDPGELLVAAAGNQVEGPASVVTGPTMLTVAGVVNGQAENNQATVLPTVAIAAPLGLALVNDTGVSGVDGRTSDPHLGFDPVPLAAGYEYSLTGAAGTYQPVTSPDSFLPQGLSAGFNSVFVRAYDANGDRGPDTLIEFAYVADSGGAATGSTPVTTRTVTYVYGVDSGGPTVPLGMSIILSAAEEAAAPIAIQVQTISLGGSSSSISTEPTIASGSGGQGATATGSTASQSAGDTVAAGNTGSSSGSNADGGTTPSPSPSSPASPPQATAGSTNDSTTGSTQAAGSTTSTDTASGGDSSGSSPPASDSSTPSVSAGDTSAASGGESSGSSPPASDPSTPSGDPASATISTDEANGAAVPAGTSAQAPGTSNDDTPENVASTPVPAAAAAVVAVGAGSNALEGVAPVPSATAPAAPAGVAQQSIEVVSQPAVGFALKAGQHSVPKALQSVGKTTQGPGWKRHPNPFRRPGTSAAAVPGHPTHPGTRHVHPTGAHKKTG